MTMTMNDELAASLITMWTICDGNGGTVVVPLSGWATSDLMMLTRYIDNELLSRDLRDEEETEGC